MNQDLHLSTHKEGIAVASMIKEAQSANPGKLWKEVKVVSTMAPEPHQRDFFNGSTTSSQPDLVLA